MVRQDGITNELERLRRSLAKILAEAERIKPRLAVRLPRAGGFRSRERVLLAECERVLEAAGLSRDGDGRAMVACSGGRDSMALLRVALTLLGSERVLVGHVDHGVRPQSSHDAECLAEFCARLGVRCRVEVPLEEAWTATEATLRAHRYSALERMREEAGAELILVAHTADDQAETVLFKLLRNGGLHSLSGMPQKNGRVLRPLLRVPRSEVHAYLERKGWPHWEDATNREPMYLRNRLRKELIPLIERRYVPGASSRLARLAEEARAWEVGNRLETRAEPEGRRPNSKPASSDRSHPLFASVLEGVTLSRNVWTAGQAVRDPRTVFFDAALVGPPTVRTFRPGDRIRPFGRMLGRRKVSDILGEAGVPAILRERWPVVVDTDGALLWVAGLVRGDRAPVSEGTREVWMISLRRPN